MQILLLTSTNAELTDELITELGSLLPLSIPPPNFLAKGISCEFTISDDDFKSIDKAKIIEFCHSRNIDNFFISNVNRRKKLLLCDMDSTMIIEESLDELAEILGFGAAVRELTDLSMNGEIDFSESLRRRAAMFRGKDISAALGDLLKNITVNRGAVELVKTMKKHNMHTIMVTGGFDFIAKEIAKKIGFNEYFCNRLEFSDNLPTGNLIGEILDSDMKLKILRDYCKKLSIDEDDTIAIGDGANDCEMIKAAGCGVAYRGKTPLKNSTDLHLDFSDLTTCLYLQSYKSEEMVG